VAGGRAAAHRGGARDARNVFNRQQWQGPTLNPTSTQFGQVTAVALNQMQFFTVGVRAAF